MVPPWGHMFYIGLYMEQTQQSCLKPQGIEPTFSIYHMTSRLGVI